MSYHNDRKMERHSSLSRLEQRAWQILFERSQVGRHIEFSIAYAAACTEAWNRKMKPHMTRKTRLF